MLQVYSTVNDFLKLIVRVFLDFYLNIVYKNQKFFEAAIEKDFKLVSYDQYMISS